MKPVQSQYERWPYPHVPLAAQLYREQLWQLNLTWLLPRCGQPPPSDKPKIWIAGCGTFQPYIFSRANPTADILATDLSHSSLNVVKKRMWFHGIRNVRLTQIDLEEEDQYPDETFDYIECFGVLMCLKDPLAALTRLQQRLKPGGVLRIMVYPHYGRQRIFQIQRLAKLIGLNHQEKNHPKILKTLFRTLPKSHPLRYAFFSYKDTKFDAGIVDGFLHASDRGFTGKELLHLADSADLKPAAYIHRPWGQPDYVRDTLGYSDFDDAEALYYLDIWQELRSNFIICFTPKDAPTGATADADPPMKHPLFDASNASVGIRHRARLARLALLGTTLETKTYEVPLAPNGEDFRKIMSADGQNLRAPYKDVIPRVRARDQLPPPLHASDPTPVSPLLSITIGDRVPNPLYQYLFDAFPSSNEAVSLQQHIARWEAEAAPLEDDTYPFGLTPFGTYAYDSGGCEDFLSRRQTCPVTDDFEKVRLSDEDQKFDDVRGFIKALSIPRRSPFSDAELRELWVLLFSHTELFLDVVETP